MTVTRRCKTGKTSYHDQEQAKQAIRGIRIRAEAEGQTEPIPCRSYRCEHCHRWHLTTQVVTGSRRTETVTPLVHTGIAGHPTGQEPDPGIE